MGASELPRDLVRALSRFQVWRKQRQKGSRIPQSLWRLAVRLASSYSVHRTATALKLGYYSLKKQVEAAADPPESSPPRFVELPPPPVTVSKQGLFELNNEAGETMRVQLVGYEVAEIEVLVRGFWKAE